MLRSRKQHNSIAIGTIRAIAPFGCVQIVPVHQKAQPFFAAFAFFALFNWPSFSGFAASNFFNTSVSVSGARLNGLPSRPAGLGMSLAFCVGMFSVHQTFVAILLSLYLNTRIRKAEPAEQSHEWTRSIHSLIQMPSAVKAKSGLAAYFR